MKNQVIEKIRELKIQSGTHSPSIETLLREIPEIKIEVDACFLSNPYATELFLHYLDKDLIQTGKLRRVLEFYPPQNYDISSFLSRSINIPPENIFIGNGAIEIIQAVIHKFVKKKLCVIIPTFSSYYEFINENKQVIYYHLKKENNFKLDPADFISYIKREEPDSVVIINPNNPNGGYLERDALNNIINELRDLENVIIDESFIHFAYEDTEFSQITSEELIRKYQNLIIIKSMSKDFGIAGIRAGYAVMNSKKVKSLLSNGFLWNVSGLADYFFKIYSQPQFMSEYDVVRKKYIMNTQMFVSELNNIPAIKVFPTKANFSLIELVSNTTSFDFSMMMLIDHGIYVRDCSDKIGLEGQFVRIASRSFEENLKVIAAIKEISS